MQLFPLRVLLRSVFDTFERSALRKQRNLELIFWRFGSPGSRKCVVLSARLEFVFFPTVSARLQELGSRKVALGTGLDKVPGRGFRETIPQHYAAFLQPPLRNQQHLHSMASIWKTSRS